MVTRSPDELNRPPHINRDRRAGGFVLIGIGFWILLAQFTDSALLGQLVLPLLGAGFIAWALSGHRFGLLIPGCILLSIGIATMLLAGPLQEFSGNAQGGVFFLVFAAGWGLITLLSPLVDNKVQRWPLIPAVIMAGFGTLLVIGTAAEPLLSALNYVWPVGLIVLGIYLMLRRTPQP